MKFIPYGTQDIREEDIQSVIATLRSDFLTQGPAVPRFESALSAYTGARFAIACNSATSALHLACLALGVGPGDRVWTSPITFVASANCARYCGADIDFVDIAPRTFNLCPEQLAAKLEVAQRTGRLPKVVIPVHFAGQSCDMEKIQALGRRYGFKIVEDASHAIGGKQHGHKIGAGQFADITILSFHPVKLITTAEGGAALTNDEALAHKLRLLVSHGITRDPKAMVGGPPEGDWYYQQIALGYNYRLTDLQAALGTSQLTRLDEYVRRRHEIAGRYFEALAGAALELPHLSEHAHSAFHLFVVQVEDRARVFRELRARQLGVNVHYIPVHTQPYYRDLGFRTGDFPRSEAYYRRALTLPLYPTLTDEQIEYVIRNVREVVA